MIKSIIGLLIIFFIAGLLYNLYVTTFPAGIGFSSSKATDLAMLPCRPYLPGRRLVSNYIATTNKNLTLTQQLGDIWWDTDSNATNPSEIGNCLTNIKLDQASTLATANILRQQAVELTNTVEVAKGFAANKEINRFTRNIFAR